MERLTVNDWIEGELVSFADLNDLQEVLFVFAAAFAGILLGSVCCNGTLSVAVDSGSLNVTVGGSDETELFVLGGRIVNQVPSTVLTVQPNASGTPRVDTIVATFAENQVNPFQRAVRQPDTTISTETCYELAQACTFSVVQAGGTVPSGSYAVGTITVPPNSENLSAGAAVITLPTLASVIRSMSVESVNGLMNALSIVCPDGSIQVAVDETTNEVQITAAAAAASVTSLQALQGAITLACPDNSVTFSVQGNTIEITAHVASAVTSVNTLGGAVQIVGDGKYIGVANSDGDIEVSFIGDPVPVGATRYRFARITGLQDLTVTLPALTTGNWLIRAQAVCTVTNANQSLSLSGCTSSEAAMRNGAASTMSPEITQITGTAQGGQSPSVTLHFTGSNTSFGNGQLLEIWAYRDS